MTKGRCAGTSSLSNIDITIDNDVKGVLSFIFSKMEDSREQMDVAFTFVPADLMFFNGDNGRYTLNQIYGSRFK